MLYHFCLTIAVACEVRLQLGNILIIAGFHWRKIGTMLVFC